ncbi:MAG: segregation/condensation protein A [Candidatus Riflebacteria bacterium]|nr:segregation/condensation protein A [Candidatus Riflebacteria bacterium]
MQALAIVPQPEPERSDAGIDILVEMAERNEIDPWDIDILQVTDRYLRRLDERGEANLPVTGKMLFYAAVLLRMKAEILARQCDLGQAITEDLEDAGWDDEPSNVINVALERWQRRRVDILVYPRPRRDHHRPITLQDLIDALTLYERQSASRRRRSPGVMVTDDVIESTHQDHLGNDIEQLRGVLGELVGSMTGTVRFFFHELIRDGLSPITAFMALMFLASDSVVDLEQEDFYGDLVVLRV